MARRGQSLSIRGEEKEAYWRGAVLQWQHSGLSQAEFCRKEGLNANAFSWWKNTIPKRDATPAKVVNKVATVKNKGARLAGREGDSASAGAQFVRLEVANDFSDADKQKAGNIHLPTEAVPDPAAVLAAEIIMPTTECRVRIFNGANPSTLSALISALALI